MVADLHARHTLAHALDHAGGLMPKDARKQPLRVYRPESMQFATTSHKNFFNNPSAISSIRHSLAGFSSPCQPPSSVISLFGPVATAWRHSGDQAKRCPFRHSGKPMCVPPAAPAVHHAGCLVPEAAWIQCLPVYSAEPCMSEQSRSPERLFGLWCMKAACESAADGVVHGRRFVTVGPDMNSPPGLRVSRFAAAL